MPNQPRPPDPGDPADPAADPAHAPRRVGRGFGRSLGDLLRIDPAEQWAALVHLGRWLVIGSVVGVVSGTASAVFLYGLAVATDAREADPWLLYLLPVGGLVMGLAYAGLGGRARLGNNLVVGAMHDDPETGGPIQHLPLRMAPLVLVGTWVTHLFGGSAGREGTAIQMGASLSDGLSRLLRLRPAERRVVLIAGVAGGFGSVFGVPLAGAVFALEVQALGRLRHDALLPALTASIVGTVTFHLWDLPHDVTPSPELPAIALDPAVLAGVALAAVVFGLVSAMFIELTFGLRELVNRLVPRSWLRPVVGGVVVIALTTALGTQQYLGLSLPLIAEAFETGDVVAWAFLAKLVLTAVTLAAGFQGGEVTPLFVIGATLGAVVGGVLGPVFGGPVELYVAAGFIGVFAAATNTPLACTIMGIELFGAGALPYLAVACVIAYVCSLHRGIYETQRVGTPKVPGPALPHGTTVLDEQRRRRPWSRHD